jgi:glycerophosphoryl diester phosphodiesterase
VTRPLIIGHRGAPGYRPEHTRSSYELALDLGVDAVEPDVVVTRDGVLVVRHENEIGSTTDVAQHPEFASRRASKIVDGERLTGWFVEDFTWAELATLRCRERLPALRPGSATFDDREPILRLRELLDLVRSWSVEHGSHAGIVIEIKHAAYFSRLGWDVAELLDEELRDAGWNGEDLPLVFESFEPTVLTRLRERGVAGTFVYLLDAAGSPRDLVAEMGEHAPTYAETAAPRGLDGLVGRFDGVSVAKSMLFATAEDGRATRPSRLVSDAHDRGLQVYTWTCRPENVFLLPPFRIGEDPAVFGDYASEWEVIRDGGVDAVFVDHADLGVGFFRGEGSRP